MSAAEIIEQFKRLPPEEQRQVQEFVNARTTSDAVRYASDEEFRKAADEVYTKYDNLMRKLAQ